MSDPDEQAAASRLTRRALLGGGGARLAGAAALGAVPATLLSAPRASAARRAAVPPRNVLLIVLDRVRADTVGAYAGDADGRQPASTPNIDALAAGALRFRHAVPEAMPALPARRAILTGMRAYPFRDWRAAAGLPAMPGWNGIYPYQPLMPELLRVAGVHTVYVTDNPLLGGPRSQPWLRPTRRLHAGRTPGQRSYFAPLAPGTPRVEPAARVLAAGLDALEECARREPFLLGLDAFDPDELLREPVSYTSAPLAAQEDVTSVLPQGRTFGRDIPVHADAARRDGVLARYRDEVARVDRAVGRVLAKLEDLRLADRTLVYLLGDCGIALGEQGVFGQPTGIYHRPVYEIPYVIRDPDGRRAGDLSDWFASTHDVASTVLSWFGVTVPGKLAGEDLTALLADDDVSPRPFFTSALDSQVIVGDSHRLLLGETSRQDRQLYETSDLRKPGEIERRTIAEPTRVEELWHAAVRAAGGTLPDFGPTRPLAPRPERTDGRVPDDGTLTQDEQDANKLENLPVGAG